MKPQIAIRTHTSTAAAIWSLLGAVFLAQSPAVTIGETTVVPQSEWQRRTPAEVGLDAGKLDEFRRIVGGRGCIVRHGYLVYSWGDYDKPHDVASALKPLYSYLLMRALESGKLVSLDTPVADFWQDHPAVRQQPNHQDQQLTFRHLGFQTACLGYREAPGTAFDYNDLTMGFFWDTLINKVYGVAWEEAEGQVIAPLLSEPLQFQDGTPHVLQAKTGRFQISARDFCRFGLLLLSRGNWSGKQLLREDLAMMSVTDPLPLALPRTTGEVADTIFPLRSIGGPGNQCDHAGGYSWMWWLNRTARDGRLWFPDVPDDFFACLGHWGQEGMAVFPSQDIVVSWIGNKLHGDRDRGNQAFRNLVEAVTDEPKSSPHAMRGQIVVDPEHPTRMVYHDTWIDDPSVPGGKRLRPCLFVGPGDPEDLLWNNTRENIELLKSRGARCTYITAELRDFGGGSLPPGEQMEAHIAQWNRAVCELESHGIITVFFFFDDGARRPDWKDFVDRIVARLKYHRLLVWCVAEEYLEWGDDARSVVPDIATRIRAADQFGHLIGLHQHHGTRFDFAGDPRFDMFLMQCNVDDPDKLHAGCLDAWKSVSGRHIVNMSECENHGKSSDSTVRRLNWASVMGGASAVQVLFMGRASDPEDWNTDKRYRDCATLMDFMQGTQVNAMVPMDALASADTQYVLAQPGKCYIAYTSQKSKRVGIRDLAAGRYTLRWIDCASGLRAEQLEVAVREGDTAWSPPASLGPEVAVYVVRTGDL